MTREPLPAGVRLVMDPGVRRFQGGRVLVGGAGGRIVTLTAAGRDALEDLRRATPATEAARVLGRRLVDAGIAHPRWQPAAVPPTVTVVVPVRDRHVALDALLDALGATHPVVVVDDGSADPASIAAVCARHGARVLARQRCGGPAAARNTALTVAVTDLVAFIDSDCMPPPGWIERLVPHFVDPGVVAVAPRIRPRQTSGRASIRERFAAVRSPLDLGPREGPVGPGRPLAYVPAAALVVRRTALAGGFDDTLRYGEDVDLVWRLHDAGGRVRYDPDVVVEHSEPSSWRGLLARRRRYGTSAAPLSGRHPARLAPVVLRPWPAATMVAALSGRPRTALTLSGLSAVLLARRVASSGVPPSQAAWWAARGTLQTTIAAGQAATMLTAPGLVISLSHRRLRRPALSLLLLPPLTDWLARRPALDPVRWTLASIADDVAYGAGVWIGCLREGAIRPVVPAVRRAG